MRPKEILTAYVEAFNQNNIEAMLHLYHDDAVNHQIPDKPIIGKNAIREMLHSEFDTAQMSCIIENIFEDGEWGILEWKDPIGLRGCALFHIVDGKIKEQREYWDKLSFLRLHKLPIPKE